MFRSWLAPAPPHSTRPPSPPPTSPLGSGSHTRPPARRLRVVDASPTVGPPAQPRATNKRPAHLSQVRALNDESEDWLTVLLLHDCGAGMGAGRVPARASPSPSSNSGASAVPALLSQFTAPGVESESRAGSPPRPRRCTTCWRAGAVGSRLAWVVLEDRCGPYGPPGGSNPSCLRFEPVSPSADRPRTFSHRVICRRPRSGVQTSMTSLSPSTRTVDASRMSRRKRR